jgi:hypothetical protein
VAMRSLYSLVGTLLGFLFGISFFTIYHFFFRLAFLALVGEAFQPPPLTDNGQRTKYLLSTVWLLT